MFEFCPTVNRSVNRASGKRLASSQLGRLWPAASAADTMHEMRTVARKAGTIAALGLGVFTAACASTTRNAVPRPFPVPSSPSSPHPSTEPSPPAPPGISAAPNSTSATVIGTALDLRGSPYRNGGADPSGFDCSGFTQYVYARHGVALPRAVFEQFKIGVAVTAADLEPGDLVFFTTTAPGASHVAIALGGGEFVHAPSSTGVVRVERLSVKYWANRYLGARRIRQP
jgi:peptidoglycan DL-endopeptidase CwlO